MAKKITAPKTATELNNYLGQVLADIRNADIENEDADVIAKISDKINKNVLNQILYKKATNDKNVKIMFLES